MYKEMGKRIRLLRVERGWQQKELAQKINITPQVISNIERGVTAPSITDLFKLADIFGVSERYIALGNHVKAEDLP